MAKYYGLVEGFYWKKEHSVEGRYGEFNPDKRRRLLEFMGTKGLNVYVYDPKLLRGDNYERAYAPSLIGDSHYWDETFRIASDNGIDFVWGIAPGRHEHWQRKLNDLHSTIDFVLNLGAAGFSLLFDDVEEAETESEMKCQAELANALSSKHPGRIYGLCSAVYCGGKEELEEKLNILDGAMDPNIPLVFTGKEVWPESIEFADMPRYESGRKSIVWDNWMASDTNDPGKLKFMPPQGRECGLFREIEGYWLNPNFPVERIIHMVSAVGGMLEYDGSFPGGKEEELLKVMARDWANFLDCEEEPILRFMMISAGKDSGYLHERDIQNIVHRWPSLGPVFDRWAQA